MALYIPHSIFHLARLLYVRPETFGPYYGITHSCGLAATTVEMELYYVYIIYHDARSV